MAEYWIKGDDGEEYGPVTPSELTEWIDENRAGHDTPTRRTDADSWLPLASWPELTPLLERRADADRLPFPGAVPTRIAPLVPRICAYLIDVLLVGIISNLVAVLALPKSYQLDKTMYRQMIEGRPLEPHQVWILLLMMAVYVVYFTLFHGYRGQTPGKRLFGLRVVDAGGLTIGYWKAFVRAVASLLSQMPYYAGYLIALLTPTRTTLHDFIAKTYVVRP